MSCSHDARVEAAERCLICTHAKVQHVRAGWKGNRGLPYHFYLIFDYNDSRDAVALSYDDRRQLIV